MKRILGPSVGADCFQFDRERSLRCEFFLSVETGVDPRSVDGRHPEVES